MLLARLASKLLPHTSPLSGCDPLSAGMWTIAPKIRKTEEALARWVILKTWLCTTEASCTDENRAGSLGLTSEQVSVKKFVVVTEGCAT